MQVIVDDLLTTYQKSGKGQVIVLLHGWGDDHRTFARAQNDLSKNFEVLSVDLPGFGQTQAPSEAWTLDKYAQFVADFLKKIGVKQVYALVGHSNGGAVAIRGLGSGVLKAEKLILIAAAGVRSGQTLKKALLKVAAKSGKAATFWLPTTSKLKLRRRFYGVTKSDLLVAPHLEETFKNIVRQDIQDDAKKVTQPALLIYGQSDTAVPIKNARILAKLLRNSQLIEMPAAGHFLHQEAPNEVLKYMTEFLKK